VIVVVGLYPGDLGECENGESLFLFLKKEIVSKTQGSATGAVGSGGRDMREISKR
jgi:hypothetical protein